MMVYPKRWQLLVILISCWYGVPTVKAYPWRAAACMEGGTSIGGSHLWREGSGTDQTLSQGGLTIDIDGTQLSENGNAIMSLYPDQDYTVRLYIADPSFFRGFLIRVGTMEATWTVPPNDSNVQDAGWTCPDAVGLTHTSNTEKTTVEATLRFLPTFDTSVGTTPIDVTVVTTNNSFEGSYHYYSGYSVEVMDEEAPPAALEETAPTTAAPTNWETTSSPTSFPTGQPVRPTPISSTVPPTYIPTSLPTTAPTTSEPTLTPTVAPLLLTQVPSLSPTGRPSTSVPTAHPTLSPSAPPTTISPTRSPSNVVSVSKSPTALPSTTPSTTPTTNEPTFPPPTTAPTKTALLITNAPATNSPTVFPTVVPTSQPSIEEIIFDDGPAVPTGSPEKSEPTPSPTTNEPSSEPPSPGPTVAPTDMASMRQGDDDDDDDDESAEPTLSTTMPSLQPSTVPSDKPSSLSVPSTESSVSFTPTMSLSASPSLGIPLVVEDEADDATAPIMLQDAPLTGVPTGAPVPMVTDTPSSIASSSPSRQAMHPVEDVIIRLASTDAPTSASNTPIPEHDSPSGALSNTDSSSRMTSSALTLRPRVVLWTGIPNRHTCWAAMAVPLVSSTVLLPLLIFTILLIE